MFALSFALSVAMATGTAPAESEAVSCVQVKTWEAQSDGWSIRAHQDSEVAVGSRTVLTLAALPGVEYRIEACGSTGTQVLDLAVYDADGHLLQSGDKRGIDPGLVLTPGTQGLLYVVAQLSAADAGKKDVALVVLYR